MMLQLGSERLKEILDTQKIKNDFSVLGINREGWQKDDGLPFRHKVLHILEDIQDEEQKPIQKLKFGQE